MHYQYNHFLGLLFVYCTTLKFNGTIPPSWQYETLKRDPFYTWLPDGIAISMVFTWLAPCDHMTVQCHPSQRLPLLRCINATVPCGNLQRWNGRVQSVQKCGAIFGALSIQEVSSKTRHGIDEALQTWFDLYFDTWPGPAW